MYKGFHVPSMINQSKDLYVDLPNIGQNDFIPPGSLQLLLNVELTGMNTQHTIVSNIGKSIVQRAVFT